MQGEGEEKDVFGQRCLFTEYSHGAGVGVDVGVHVVSTASRTNSIDPVETRDASTAAEHVYTPIRTSTYVVRRTSYTPV